MKPFHILIALVAMYAPVAWSQCAPGIPSAGNPGCIPPDQGNSPYYQDAAPSAPQPVWADRWGAVAVDLGTGQSGATSDQGSESQAKNEALSTCERNGGTKCEIVLWYFNQCAAIAEKPEGGGFSNAHADTVERAEQLALQACGGSCKVIYTKCSLPVRVR
ncbi:hypothetical protein FHW69_001712 [Luteibacter sp. Sphag1AF]|uniref:DUF4189 domain-containing protein n=1 Tax=Luteibacter sp. Sphag1AF TaxID=2587031 RepID=UPI00161E3D8C|nr:hypothetical protein [Luteibacter sp. Sphag1AF]